MALAKDEGTAAGRGRVLDKYRDKGVVLYRSDFDGGFDGWIDHWDGFRPWPVVSLTTEMQYRGTRCLMLSTGEHASPLSNDVSNATGTFKRFARHDEYRYHSLSAFVGLGVGGFSSSWSTFALYFDTQKYDNSSRSFFKAQCVVAAAPTKNRWQVRGDGGDTDFKNVTGADGRIIGSNENKHNMFYVRLTVDLAANSGAGGYHELQIGPSPAGVFALTGLGAGSSTEPPQWDGSDLITDFAGGMNIGFGISRATSVTGGCQLFVDDVVYSATNSLT